ncbi:MAG: hypothetical protein JSW53_01620 [Candidatus Bathyarchaeota archaeon]|nr:MAG: hypothetical protein JSW53_01620 [Candidatus Bathyarchaeota archaeon]
MKVLNKKAFRLPFIERSRFVTLMRLGLGFDKARGVYHVENYNEVEKVIDIISDIFEGEEISFLQTCISCGKDFACSDCMYNVPCETKNLPLQCICSSCLKNTETE